MAYNFPANPAVGDNYTSPDGKLTYGYNGFAWDMKAKTAAAQRPELIELMPFLMEAGAPNADTVITGDLITPNTKVIAIPDSGIEVELPSTFISLTEISATIPCSTVARYDTYDLYLETDGLRSQRMRQVVVTMAPVHQYLEPASVPAGSAGLNIRCYYDEGSSSYVCNSGSVVRRVGWDGVDMSVMPGPGYVESWLVTPDTVPDSHECAIRIVAIKNNVEITTIPSHDLPLIFTCT